MTRAEKAVCAPCRGTGKIRTLDFASSALVECWHCDGKGWVPRLHLPGEGTDEEETDAVQNEA